MKKGSIWGDILLTEFLCGLAGSSGAGFVSTNQG